MVEVELRCAGRSFGSDRDELQERAGTRDTGESFLFSGRFIEHNRGSG